jgi:uncharacterized protein
MSAPAVERAQLLDALRGFALLGIVLANYAGLSYWVFLPQEEQAQLPGAFLDATMNAFHFVFIEGKFYSIFSLLFGIGFGFFLLKGTEAMPRFMRRMLVLALIGGMHMRFLWEGDILFLYAVLGMLLPMFRHMRDRTLVITAAFLLLSPIALDAITVLSDGRFAPAAPIHAAGLAEDKSYGFEDGIPAHYVPDGGWKEFMVWQHGGWIWRIDGLIATHRIPKVFALFLLGLWVARKGIFRDPSAHRALLRKVALIGAIVGLPCSVLLWWSELHFGHVPAPIGLVHTAAYAFSVVPLALAYASCFALLWTGGRAQRALHLLAPAGRMALTNYLMQTIIALALFTGMGLGWGARVSPITFESLAVGVFIFQVLYSHWWLKRFHFGPMEWAWRSLTYGKVMGMRK